MNPLSLKKSEKKASETYGTRAKEKNSGRRMI
jgi:hypothetical protein